METQHEPGVHATDCYIFAPVRKYTAIILLFVLNSGLAEQFRKLPFLVAHYMDHQQRDKSIDVWDFLSMHYWGQDINDNDDEQDRQLPFKTIHTGHSSPFSVSKPLIVKHTELPEVIVSFPLRDDDLLPSPALSSLFRPPQA
ncbi:MAG: hypothetical protein QM731_27045 [Chitinophagaceae bacterium]